MPAHAFVVLAGVGWWPAALFSEPVLLAFTAPTGQGFVIGVALLAATPHISAGGQTHDRPGQ